MNYLRILAVAGFALGTCASLAACGEASSERENQESAFVRTEAAPPTPPVVTVDGVEIDPSHYEWVIDGEAVQFKAAENESDAPLTEVRAPEGDTVSVELNSPVRPSDFTVVFFDEVDEAGVPTTTAGREIDCLRDAACTVSARNGTLAATVEQVGSPVIMVVHLLYADVVDDADSTAVNHQVGSWGVRFQREKETS